MDITDLEKQIITASAIAEMANRSAAIAMYGESLARAEKITAEQKETIDNCTKAIKTLESEIEMLQGIVNKMGE